MRKTALVWSACAIVLSAVFSGSAAGPVSEYTRRDFFRDNGNEWDGRWTPNKTDACNGNGGDFGYPKGFYGNPVVEGCPNGAQVVRIDQGGPRKKSKKKGSR